MLERTNPSKGRQWWPAIALAGVLYASPSTILAEGAANQIPDGVCYLVDGAGYIVSARGESDTLKVPIGALSVLSGGDSIVVLTGTIAVLDFRTGQRSVFGQGTRHKMPKGGYHDEGWKVTKERLTQLFSGPEPPGPEPGTTRDAETALWPDGDVEFGPDVPVDFQWWGVSTPLSAIQIRFGDQQIELPLSASQLSAGRLTWGLDKKPSGSVDWCLLDTDGEPLLKGRFNVLTSEQADEKRAMYRAQARGDVIPLELEAVLRALADRSFLW